MRVAVAENQNIVLKEVDNVKLDGKKGAIIKVLGCGLCGSDIVKYKHNEGETYLGHEVVGEIVQLKNGFFTKFRKGDKVVLGHHIPCMKCHFCLNENYSMCPQFKESNIVPGGFSEYIFVSENHLENTVFKVGKNVDDMEISFMEPLACCLRAVKRAGVKQGTSSLVIGLGSIGLLMGQAIKAYGGDVIGCDLISERVGIAFNLNFDCTLQFEDDDATSEKIKSLTQGYGADIVFMTSGSEKSMELAMKSVRDGGTILVFSSISTLDGYRNNDIYYRELKVLGSYSPSPKDLEEAHKLLESKKVVVKYLASQYSINDLERAINDTMANKILKAYIKM